MKVLITGAAGFIARHLIEDLGSPFNIIACSRKELELTDTAAVESTLKHGKFDAVIHAATYDAAPLNSPKDPAKVLENNLLMFFNLARCQNYFEKMIYFGSGAEFSRLFWKPKMSEDYFNQHVPVDQYGLSKYTMTQYALTTNNIFNLRLFGLFGKYDDWRYRVIPAACAKAALGLPLTVEQNKAFDFLYIDQLIEVVRWMLLNRPRFQVYNVCSGGSYTFAELIQKVNVIAGSKVPIHAKNDEPVLTYSGDNTRLLSELTQFTIPPIDDSIADLYTWYLTHKALINPNEFHY